MIPRTSMWDTSKISRIIFWWRQLSKWHWTQVSTDIQDTLIRYVENWVTTFDCADIYEWVEEQYWTMLKSVHKRLWSEVHSKIRIHTKCVPNINDIRMNNVNFDYIQKIVDTSLKKIWVDQLDLVQLHHWDYEVHSYIEIAHHLKRLKDKGKIKRIGMTNYNTKVLKEIIESWISILSSQNQFSLLDDRPSKWLTSLCKEHDFELLCYWTLAGGLLTNAYLWKACPVEPVENRSLRKYLLMIQEFWWWALFQELLTSLDQIAKKYEVTIADIAMQYVLEKPSVAGIIVWTRNSKYVDKINNITQFVLDWDDYTLIHSILSKKKGIPWDCFDIERNDPIHSNIMKMDLNEIS